MTGDLTNDNYTVTRIDGTWIILGIVTVNNGTGSGSYALGETVTITADAPPAGYKFKTWEITPSVIFTDGTTADSSTAKFTMSASSVTATAIFEQEVGIDPLRMTNYELRVYPNPTHGELYISISDCPTCDIRHAISDITIYDMLGRIQNIGKPEIDKSEIGNQTIDISHLPSGVYFLRAAGQTVKVVKE